MKAFIFVVVVLSVVAVCSGQQFGEVDNNHDNLIDFNEFQGLFSLYDKDGNGAVTLAEVLAVSNLPKDQAVQIFNQYDLNKDGNVDLAELRVIFNKLDTDGDGSLTTNEYSRNNPDIVG